MTVMAYGTGHYIAKILSSIRMVNKQHESVIYCSCIQMKAKYAVSDSTLGIFSVFIRKRNMMSNRIRVPSHKGSRILLQKCYRPNVLWEHYT